jgi:hypothetical protein
MFWDSQGGFLSAKRNHELVKTQRARFILFLFVTVLSTFLMTSVATGARDAGMFLIADLVF